MLRAFMRFLLVVGLFLFTAPAFPATCNWINPAGGFWGTVANWDCAKVPAAGDTANITLATVVPYIVTTDLVVTVANLTIGPVPNTAPTITLGINGFAVTVTNSGTIAQNGIVQITAVNLAVANGATLTIQSGGLVRTSGSGRLQINGSTVVNGELRLDADGVTGNPQGTAGGTLTIAPTGLLNFSATGNDIFVADVNVTNNGTVDYTGAGPGQISLINNNVFTNNATMNVGDRDWSASFGVGSIVNSATGQYRKTTGSGTHVIAYPFTNSGTVDVQNGVIQVSNGSNSGTISIAGSSNFDLTDDFFPAMFTFSTGTTISGLGTVRVRGFGSGGVTLTVSGNVSVPRMVLGADGRLGTDATITGSGALTITQNLDWFTGTMAGTGQTVIPSGVTFNITGTSGGKNINGRTINNSGTTVMNANAATSITGSNGVFNNLAGGTFDAQTDADLLGSGTFSNAGLLKKSAGAARTSLQQWLLSNSGTIQLLSGELGPNGTLGPGYTQTAGSLTLNGGNFTTGDNACNIQGGTVSGTGTITVGTLTNTGGVIGPGMSAGTLSITGNPGNYTQSANGTLAIEIGGLTAGTQYDQVIVTGAATLAGTLALTLINNFSPNPGDVFTVMTYASHTGNFSAITGTNMGGGKSFQEAANATNVTITTTNLPSGDANGDGQVSVADIFYLINNLFAGGPNAIGPSDPNGDGQTNVSDVFYLINFLFAGGPAPH